MGKPQRRMDTQEILTVTDWLRKHQQKHADERPSFVDLANRIESELGIKTTPPRVRGLHKMLGLKWMPRRQTSGTKDNQLLKELVEFTFSLAAMLDVRENDLPPNLRAFLYDNKE